MKKFLLILLLLIYYFSSVGFAAFENIKPQVDAVINGYISSEKNVGAIVGIINKKNKDIWSYGTLELGSENPPQANTLFEIGSISKVFTGILLATLANEGVVSLDDKISKYIKGLPKITSDITLKELSTHTSGLPRLPSNFAPTDSKNPYADYTEELLLEFMKSFTPEKHPTEFDLKYYSNVGVGLLGYILSLAAGKSYEELLKEKITDTLKMTDTVVKLNKEQKERFTLGHDSVLEPTSAWDLNILVGAGGIRSTMNDMLKFAKANLFPDETPISENLKLAQKIIYTKENLSIGLGWVFLSEEKKNFFGHNGGTGGFVSFVGLNQKASRAVVSLTNTASSIHCIDDIALFALDCTPPQDHPVSEKLLDTYIGTYVGPFNFIITRKKSYLIYELVGQEKGRMRALSDNKFSIQGIATMEFHTDDEDKVTHLIFEQGDYKGKLEKK